MKYSLLTLSLSLGLAIWFYPQTSNSNGTGSPGGRTGSTGDNGSTCQDCHYAGFGTGATITSNIPLDGYIPGDIYTITATVQQSGISKFGFEITSEQEGTKTGSFLITNSSETQLTNSNNAVTHKAGGTSGTGSKTWTFDWEAPFGVGPFTDVRFYGSFIGANGNGQNTGDTYHFTELVTQPDPNINKIEEYTINSFTISKNNIYITEYIKEIQIYDITGKLILNYTNLHPTEEVNLNMLPKGIYIINTINTQGLLKDTKKIQIN